MDDSLNAASIISARKKAFSSAERKLITDACAFAKERHAGVARYSGLPYYTHPFAVGKLLAEIGMEAPVVAAGILHDTIEDTEATVTALSERFGEEVAFFVDSVSNLSEVRYQGLDARVKSLQKLFVAVSKDLRVVVIKLMDRLHNMRTLSAVPKEKQLRIAKETQRVYAPLAERMGMGQVKTELEDLAFSFIEPEIYAALKQNIDEIIGSVSIERIEQHIRDTLSVAGIPQTSFSSRIKSVYSTHLKMQHKKYGLHQVQDLIALRVVVSDIPTAYTVLGVLHEHWHSIPGAFKDYISLPKPNGYRALHTRVIVAEQIVEIQILTHAMHQHAQFGVASHFVYKEKRQGIAGLDLQWFRRLLGSRRGVKRDGWLEKLSSAYAMTADSTSRFVEDIESDFLQDRMFIFTPKGEVVDLPRGATVADFAFAIHSDIGLHAEGAFVNGTYVSLRHELHNGDVVDVQMSKKKTVTHKWLDWVKTTEARSRIRQAIKKSS